MKFLHAADLHLDSPLRGLPRNDETPVDALRGATRAAFGNLVELAIEEKVAFVLLAGDLYDGTWQDFKTALFLSKKLGELDRAGIRVFGVLGNHDAQSKLTRALEKPKNLTLFPATSPRTELLNDLDVAIHGQSFGQQQVVDNLAAGYPPARPGMFNIGLLHTSLDGREGHASYAPCRLDDLRARDYQYWALGHVHAREVVSTDPWVIFPGCLQGRHARETGPKGCCLVTVTDGRVERVEHRILDVVRWASCGVDLSGVDSLQGALEQTERALARILSDADDRDVAARIRFVGATPLHSELRSRTPWLRQQILTRAAEHHGERLWIEKVLVATSSRVERADLLTADDALGKLARSILEVREEPGAVRGLAAALAALHDKLPAEVSREDDGLRLDDPDTLARLIREAKDLLLGRLLETGAEP